MHHRSVPCRSKCLKHKCVSGRSNASKFSVFSQIKCLIVQCLFVDHMPQSSARFCRSNASQFNGRVLVQTAKDSSSQHPVTDFYFLKTTNSPLIYSEGLLFLKIAPANWHFCTALKTTPCLFLFCFLFFCFFVFVLFGGS